MAQAIRTIWILLVFLLVGVEVNASTGTTGHVSAIQGEPGPVIWIHDSGRDVCGGLPFIEVKQNCANPS